MGTIVCLAQTAEKPNVRTREDCPPGISCRYDATLTRQFTPHFGVPPNSYAVYVTSSPIEAVVRSCAAKWPAQNQQSWSIQEADPFEAFGEAGPYDRPKVGRLYVGKRAKVARGPVVADGRTVAALTLISPYPDNTLSRLEAGTMIIVFRLPH